MRPPQPDEDPRTDHTPEVGTPPTAPLPDGVGTDGAAGDLTTDGRPTGDRTTVDRATDGEPPTSPAPWRGAAQVPPPRPRQRWWQRDHAPAGPPPPRDPTLLLPTGELPSDDPETRTPVDPWAGADPLPVTHPGGTHDDWAVPGYPPPVHHQPPDDRPAHQQPRPPQPSPPQQPQPPQARQVPPPQAPPPPRQTPAPYTMPQARQVARPTAAPRPAPAARPAPPTPPPAPKGPPPAGRGPRRRRRWPTTMSLLTLLTVACCCGGPAYYGKPLWDQYPASPALPGNFADLRLSDDGDSQETVAQLKDEMRSAHLLAEETFAGVYRDGNGKQVVLYGITGFRMTPGSDLDAELGRIADEYQLGTVTAFDTDDRGSHLNCGTGQADGTDVVVCVWADHGSLGTALFTRRSVEESAELTYRLRGDAISRQ